MVAAESRRIARLATDAGITVAYEFHDGTLTDTTQSAVALLEAAPDMRTLWQPPHGLPHDQRIGSLNAILPWLAHVHAFYWSGQPRVRHPLDQGAPLWTQVLEVLAQSQHDRAILLEFVDGDDVEQFRRDARTLCAWIEQCNRRTP